MPRCIIETARVDCAQGAKACSETLRSAYAENEGQAGAEARRTKVSSGLQDVAASATAGGAP